MGKGQKNQVPKRPQKFLDWSTKNHWEKKEEQAKGREKCLDKEGRKREDVSRKC